MGHMTIEEYAIDLAASAIESVAEDDLNEDGQIAEDSHEEACELAIRLARAIRANPERALALVGPVTS